MPENPDRPRVCVVGSINVDLVVRSPRLPSAGETVLGGPFETHAGGKGANQAVAAARLGGGVVMVGRVGDDEHGRLMIEALVRAGIDVSRVAATAGAATGVAMITVDAAGENTIVVAPGANAAVSPADAEAARDAIAHADVLLLQLEVPAETVARAASIARDAGTTVVLNAAPGRALPLDLLASVDVLVVNESEAAALGGRGAVAGVAGFGESPAADVLDRLRNTGAGTVVLTLGPRGAVYAHGARRGEAAGFAVEAVDTVGAGDAFTATLAVRWAELLIGGGRGGVDDMGAIDALCWANAAGALACTRRGAIPSLPTRGEVRELLRREARPNAGGDSR